MAAPYRATFEAARAEQAGDPYAFSFKAQAYVLRGEDGRYSEGRLAWSAELMRTLASLHGPRADAEQAAGVGDMLRGFLGPLWAAQEKALLEALEGGREVIVTLRFAAAELYALPWELLRLEASGQHLGELPGVLLRYAWPQSASEPPRPAPPAEHGRLLFAWSAAGGGVPADRQREVLTGAFAGAGYPFSVEDELAACSLEGLAERLERARAAGRPYAALHLLAHGAASGESVGLALNDGPGRGGRVVADAAELRRVLAPYAGSLRLVVLCACRSGDAGALGSRLGSLAQSLHRAGFQAVLASRFPLAMASAQVLCEELYGRLMALSSLETAFLAVQQAVASSQQGLQWASLQLHARPEDGDDTRPFVLRPYRGLLAFQEADARFFFGRDAECGALVERLREARAGGRGRLQVVAGSSGSGKSSLVLAGLVPSLRRAGEGWRALVLRPSAGADPLDALWRALLSAVTGEPDPPPRVLTADHLLATARRLAAQEPGVWWLLVIDQLEEVFSTQVSAEAKDRWGHALWALCQSPDLPVVALATLRVDFLGHCADIHLDPAGLRLDQVVYDERCRVFVSQMGRDDVRTAIERPAQRVGLRFEDGLVERILEDIGDEPGMLPLLQYTLDLLWERRSGRHLTDRAYDALGGVEGALTSAADEMLARMGAAEHDQARSILLEAVSLEGDKRTRRRVSLDSLRSAAGQEHEAFERALERLVRHRLVVLGEAEQGSARTLDVAHEFLIRRWRTLAHWVDEAGEQLLRLRELRTWAGSWGDHREDPDRGRSYALRGSRLGYALEVSQKPGVRLDALCATFLRESERLELRARWRRRAVMYLFVGAALAVAGVLALAYHRQSLDQDRIVALQQETEQARDQAMDTRAMVAARSASGQNPTRALLLLELVDPASRRQRWAQAVSDLSHQPFASAILQVGSPVEAAVFSPDGASVLSASKDGVARLWSASGRGQPVSLVGHEAPLSAAVFCAASGDDAQPVVASASQDGTVRVWSLEGEEQAVLGHDGEQVLGLACAPGGERLLSWTDGGNARLWSLEGALLATLSGHDGPLLSADLDAAGHELVTGGADGRVRLWSLEEQPRLVGQHRGHSAAVAAVSLAPGGDLVFSGDEQGRVLRWEPGAAPGEVARHRGAVRSLHFDQEGRRVVSASADRSARVLGAARGEGLQMLEGHTLELRSARFSPDGRMVVTASDDETVRVWFPDRNLASMVLSGHDVSVRDARFDAAGERVVTTAWDGTVRIWPLGNVRVPQVIPAHHGLVGSVAFGLSADQIVSASWDGSVRITWLLPGMKPREFDRVESVPRAVRLHPSGHWLATAYADGLVRAWSVQEKGVYRDFSGHDGPAVSLAFSADGMQIAAGGNDGSVRIWRFDDPEHPLRLAAHHDMVWGLWFDPTGTRLVSAADDQLQVLWSLPGGQELARRELHEGTWELRGDEAEMLALPMWTASMGNDETAQAWEPGAREPLTLDGHLDEVWTVGFDAAGRRAATVSADGTARLWPLDDRRVEIEEETPQEEEPDTGAPDPDLAQERPVPQVMRLGVGQATAAAISADGTRMATGSVDGQILIWEVPSGFPTIQDVHVWLETASSACLDANERHGSLGETRIQATRAAERCRAELLGESPARDQ
ncbi:MAG: CHAT domain-containing protein [Pseudomonadota bacterium]